MGTQEVPSEYQETLFHCDVDYTVNVPGNTRKLPGRGPGHPALGGPAGGGLGQRDKGVPASISQLVVL